MSEPLLFLYWVALWKASVEHVPGCKYMKQNRHKIFLVLLIFLLPLMGLPSWAILPQIPNAIETRFYQPPPQDIEAFIEKRRNQANQLISELDLLLKKETKEENKRALANALGFFEGLFFQFTKLSSEIQRPSDMTVTPPEIGSAPYSLKTLSKADSFYRKIKQRLEEYTKKRALLEDKLSSIEQNLKPLLVDYVNFREKDGKSFKTYEMLGQLLSLQAEYALQKVRITKLEQTKDYLSSLQSEFKGQIGNILNKLNITRRDVIVAKKQKDQAQRREKDQKEKFLAKRRELNRLIVTSEIRIDNIITKLNSVKLPKESRRLLNIEKRRLEIHVEGLEHQKEILSQKGIANRLDTIEKCLRYDWVGYYIDYPQSKQPQAIVEYCTEQQINLEGKLEDLKENLAQKRLDKAIVNENIFAITREREGETSPNVKKALKALEQKTSITINFLGKLIQISSDNVNKAGLLRAEIENILQLVQKRISLFERLFYRVKATFLVAWLKVKAVIYYPLWSIGESAVSFATLLKLILFLFLGVFFLRVLRKKMAAFLIKKAWLSVGPVNSISTLSYYFLLLLVILVSLSTAGVNLSQITIILGALGVGIGFGLQTITNNFISGLILLTERTVKVGDIVELEGGLTGEVKDVSIRNTVIRTYDGLDVIVPNSDFISNRVTTWTYGDDWRRLRISFGISHGSDPEEVSKLAIEVARNIPTTIEDAIHPIQVWFEGFGSSSLDFSLMVWCRMTRLKPISGLLSDYYFALFRKFKDAGIEIPFPQRDLHVRSISPKITESFKR